MTEHSTLLLVLIGAGTGLLGALLGLGGGVFLVPILTVGLGFPIREAIVVSLLSVIATASASASVNLSRGLVNLRLGLLLEVATSIGGLGGAMIAAALSQRQLFLLFGVTMAAMCVVMLTRASRRNVIPAEPGIDTGFLGGRLREGDAEFVYRVRRWPVALVASLGAGGISGLLGLGGGIIKVPVLSAFCGVPIKVAAATSTFMIGVTAATAVFVNASREGALNPHLAAAVCLGALPASLLGAYLSQRMEARALKILMALVLSYVAVRMVWEGW